ncbi:glycosyltransferase family 39 protein [Pedobacter sp. SYSU D00535]|uniref:ArnT family glycosyltransferase n=1 Tax=Pedobacter sp. SYSU D00535 TaxID=2810308 RepID=UPI001A974836|nr:glycosyltransferase family 39 protein [Pedobacter sp. SYSU D00535]
MKYYLLHGHSFLVLCIIVLTPFALFLNLDSYQLSFEEPRRGLVAIEMLIRDNSLVPTTNGVLYYNKPPLYNWVLIVLFQLFGTSEWVVRLPTVLSVIGISAVHYFFSKRYIGTNAALLSSLFFITCADILFYFSYLGEIDLFYAFVVYLQGVSIFYFYQRRSFWLLFLVSYFFTSVGVLTKGIPSIVFQGISLLMVFILNRDLKRVFSFAHVGGFAAFVLICGGYFYSYSKYYPVEPYLARLFTETFSRSAIENSTGTNLSHLLKFPAMLIKISAPWCLLFLIPAPYKRLIRDNAFLKYCLWFVIANISIYWLSPGTRDRYLYMFFPFILSILAYGLHESRWVKKDLWLRRSSKGIGTLLVLGLFVLAYFGFKTSAVFSACFCIILGITLAYLVISQKGNTQPLLLLVIMLLVGRIGFDLVVLPTKKRDDPYKADARKMASIVDNNPIYLVGKPELATDQVRFGGIEFATFKREEPTFLSFQTSFYLSKFTGRVVQYTSKKELDGFYISREGLAEPNKIEVFYRFKNRENLWFVLFKYK